MIKHIPKPHLHARRFGARCIPALTDEALYENTGVRIAFTGRVGGVSEGPYASLNIGSQVNDDPSAVQKNREYILEAFGAQGTHLIVPKQVHGNRVVTVNDTSRASLALARAQALEGADALVVTTPKLSALLCFADCVPLIIVSPTKHFAVVHAGWRGVLNGVAACAVRALASGDKVLLGVSAAKTYNVYIGPHIHAECFEAGSDVCDLFAKRFGDACITDAHHVDLLSALALGLEEAGIMRERIVDSGICTACTPDRYFSYRNSGGVCGRHGAFAYRKAR